MAIREGKWDCKVCDRKGNRGPDSYCGSCGSPRPDNVEFYLPEDAEEVTDEIKLKEAESGADWRCSYCSTQNNAFDNFCVSCGNKRDISGGDISLNQKEIYFDSPGTNSASVTIPVKTAGKGKKIIITLASIIFALIVISGIAGIKTDIDVNVTGFEYYARISYEAYKLVTEEDWSLPAGAEKISEFRAIHHYDKIPDGYITRTREVQVQIGTKKVKTGVKDLGNGYFKDIYEERPVYETRTERYNETKYRDVPVYMQKYKYRIMKWIDERPIEYSGKNKDISFNLKADELKKSPDRFRNIKTDSKYYLSVIDAGGKNYKDDVSFNTWKNTELNQSIKAEKSKFFGFFYGIKE
ncbi:MAG TPA: zinc finger Ran-binding domain-containing protein [Spirochaetota bacterium]|nr:zinc finger Ran-binding domain-containing protein [Spirochaetota bacterium]